MRCFFIYASLALLLLISGCATKIHVPPKEFDPASTRTVKELAAGLSPASQGLASWTDLEHPIRESLKYVNKKSQDELAFTQAGLRLTWGHMKRTLMQLLMLLPELDANPGLLEKHFTLYNLGTHQADTLLTGYYQPYIEASLKPSAEYLYPMYALPSDLTKGVPHFERAAIDSQGALRGKGLEIAWAKSQIDVFFLHIQGSGMLVLPDGSVRHILYAGTNQHPYVSLGKELIDRGLSTREEMSMQKIREILEARPEQAQELLNLNPKYIFFRLSNQGPYGASGAVLTPRVSCAVDRSYIPLGAVLTLDSMLPAYGNASSEHLRGIILAQDTGTMRNNHIDLFCGSGKKAAYQAGHMKGRASAYLLVSKSILTQ